MVDVLTQFSSNQQINKTFLNEQKVSIINKFFKIQKEEAQEV